MPVVRSIAVARPPAVRLPPGHYFPELSALGKKLPNLLQSGFDVYRASTDDLVLFNPLAMPLEELQAIDQKGKLAELVPDYGTLTNQLPKEMTDEEAVQQVSESEEIERGLASLGGEAPAPATGGMPAQTPVPPPNPAATSALNRTRVQAMQPGSPTSGPAPGAGRVLNGLLKPAL